MKKREIIFEKYKVPNHAVFCGKCKKVQRSSIDPIFEAISSAIECFNNIAQSISKDKLSILKEKMISAFLEVDKDFTMLHDMFGQRILILLNILQLNSRKLSLRSLSSIDDNERILSINEEIEKRNQESFIFLTFLNILIETKVFNPPFVLFLDDFHFCGKGNAQKFFHFKSLFVFCLTFQKKPDTMHFLKNNFLKKNTFSGVLLVFASSTSYESSRDRRKFSVVDFPEADDEFLFAEPNLDPTVTNILLNPIPYSKIEEWMINILQLKSLSDPIQKKMASKLAKLVEKFSQGNPTTINNILEMTYAKEFFRWNEQQEYWQFDLMPMKHYLTQLFLSTQHASSSPKTPEKEESHEPTSCKTRAPNEYNFSQFKFGASSTQDEESNSNEEKNDNEPVKIVVDTILDHDSDDEKEEDGTSLGSASTPIMFPSESFSGEDSFQIGRRSTMSPFLLGSILSLPNECLILATTAAHFGQNLSVQILAYFTKKTPLHVVQTLRPAAANGTLQFLVGQDYLTVSMQKWDFPEDDALDTESSLPSRITFNNKIHDILLGNAENSPLLNIKILNFYVNSEYFHFPHLLSQKRFISGRDLFAETPSILEENFSSICSHICYMLVFLAVFTIQHHFPSQNWNDEGIEVFPKHYDESTVQKAIDYFEKKFDRFSWTRIAVFLIYSVEMSQKFHSSARAEMKDLSRIFYLMQVIKKTPEEFEPLREEFWRTMRTAKIDLGLLFKQLETGTFLELQMYIIFLTQYVKISIANQDYAHAENFLLLLIEYFQKSGGSMNVNEIDCICR